jgi:phenylacetate-coenzyme A ligase PaaK-like adenylate-forming protein
MVPAGVFIEPGCMHGANKTMAIWEPLEFGARALALRLAAAKPLDEILELQRSRLNSLVQHARRHSAFYRKKFASVDGSQVELRDLPTSTKSEIMNHFDQALTVRDVRRPDVEAFLADDANLGTYFRDKYVLSHTSGSQGQPLLIVQTDENLELLFALQASRGNHEPLNAWTAVKHFISPARMAAVILKRGFYPSACAFEYLPEGAQRYLEILTVSLTDDDLIERIVEFRPTHLTAYASVLHELARRTEEGELNLKPELQQVVNISERLMPQAREHYAQVFGTPILNDYAMGECLFLTNGCLTSGGMHVNADWAILEVVDENNQPVPDGEKGAKVLITNLANFVQPIIRYEIGDIVTMATEPCGCGSNLPLIEGIDGRDSEMFWIDKGKGLQPLPPAMFEVALGELVDAREYQIVQEERNRFQIFVEPLPGVTLDEERARKLMQAQLKEYGFEKQLKIDVEMVDKLAPDGGDKFKRVVSKVDGPNGKKPAESNGKGGKFKARSGRA